MQRSLPDQLYPEYQFELLHRLVQPVRNYKRKMFITKKHAKKIICVKWIHSQATRAMYYLNLGENFNCFFFVLSKLYIFYVEIKLYDFNELWSVTRKFFRVLVILTNRKEGIVLV